MATEIIAPKLGMGTEPLTIVEWKFKEGERVEKGSVVLIVETEKIRHDVEAEAAGFLHIIVEEGHEAAIGSAAGILTESEEELAKLKPEIDAINALPIVERQQLELMRGRVGLRFWRSFWAWLTGR